MKKIAYLLGVVMIALLVFFAGCGKDADSDKTKSQEKSKVVTEEVATSNVTIYLPSDNGNGVKAKNISMPSDQVNPKEVLQKMISIESKDPYTIFPKHLEVQKVSVKDHLAFVEMNKAFLNPVSGGSLTEQLELASMVNTLTEFDSIKKVIFLVDGTPVRSIGGHVDMSQPLPRMERLIVK